MIPAVWEAEVVESKPWAEVRASKMTKAKRAGLGEDQVIAAPA
jgi:hypothetical protein